MVIGEVDVITTGKKRKRRKRKQMEDKRIKRKMVKTDADAAHAQSLELLDLNTMSSSLYTDRAAASFASAVLQDIGIGHEGEASHVVDRNKIRRQCKKL
ncbi:hypothetical protein AVEN_144510-1 [Araneus ventricosus]|uniref:Uncharacterized protein n=1 Tax=Araneus ventricosus TaxID=182803 RepID=A0A4Y2L958_ARAVE|nr:hypothetical protein AVEN_144510-1 [Araneus ventricosus]